MTKKQNNSIESVSSLIRRDFEASTEQFSDAFSVEELKKALTDAIKELINRDFDKLVHVLYRVDVSETKLKKAIATGTIDQVSSSIAELIIERQLQKLESRQKYRK